MEPKEKTEATATVATVKITVLNPFRDKYNKSVHYTTGQELEFEPSRAEDVVSRGLAEYVLPEG